MLHSSMGHCPLGVNSLRKWTARLALSLAALIAIDLVSQATAGEIRRLDSQVPPYGSWSGFNGTLSMDNPFVSCPGGTTQESPHFENGVISRLFGPHAGRKEGPKVPH